MSLYIQITTRCNMSCDHCCMNATHVGEDMSLEVFEKALDIDPDYVTLGGGEPTLHPKFWDFLILALAHEYNESLWLATNGSQTATAVKLARLAKKGVIACDLSQDEWHDPIADEVLQAFGVFDTALDRQNRRENDHRAIRTVSSIMKAGRAVETEVWTEENCACDSMIVKPNGKIVTCACEDAPTIGDVWSGVDFDIYPEAGNDCYKNWFDELDLEEAL